jgi:hypothetical protein
MDLYKQKSYMMKKIIGLFFFLSIIAAACKKGTFDPGATATPKASNGWWVALALGGSPLQSPVLFSTYNTANSPDSMWLDDLKNGYGFKCTTHLDYKALTFSVTGSTNAYYVGTPAFPATVNIYNGKILPKAGHSLAGNITDSIYMQAVFSDDPTDTFTIAGTARTGLIEDDY